MLNQNIAITRGIGEHEEVFDFTTDTPPRDIAAEDVIIFRMEDKGSPLLLKLNDNALGDDTQVEYDAGLDTVTVHLSQSEKNYTPDSGYTYKMYINDELAAYGNITASGTPPAEEENPPSVQYLNGHNFRYEAGDVDFDVNITDDFIVINNTVEVEVNLPAAVTQAVNVKRIHFIHMSTANVVVKCLTATIYTSSAKGSFLALLHNSDPSEKWFVEGEWGDAA